MLRIPLCRECKHLFSNNDENAAPNSCSAYPSGIPVEIIISEADHHEPYLGDNGIQFEPIEGAK